MLEIRTIEKRGILKVSSDDRKALTLLVTTEVLQRPLSEYFNTKSNPPTSFYGYASLMYEEYVVAKIEIKHRMQIILDSRDYVTQVGYQVYCNSRSILEAVSGNSIDTEVKFPSRNLTEIRFKLEPGVIIVAQKLSQPMVTCGGNGVSQPDEAPPIPFVPDQPDVANPDGTPSNPNFVPSLPYDGGDDDGNSYYPPSSSTTIKYWLTGTFLDGNGQYQVQVAEPMDSGGFISVTGSGNLLTLRPAIFAGKGPDNADLFFYELTNGQRFGGGWKPTPQLRARTITA